MSSTWVPLGAQPVPTLVDGKWLKASGGAMVWSDPPGTELAYAEITANVAINTTTEAAANVIVTAPATVFDGTPVVIEFFAARVDGPNTVGGFTNIDLYQDGASLGFLAQIINVAAQYLSTPIRVARRLTPSAGSHTYSIRCHASAGTNLVAGSGGSGQFQPAFIRITRA